MRKISKPAKPKARPSAKPARTTLKSSAKTPVSPAPAGKTSPAKRATSPRKSAGKVAAHSDFEFDVCTSFAGESRTYVAEVVTSLKRRRVRCFYDFDEQATLLGKNLFTYLDDVYRKRARFCVMFISKHYPLKLWTNHERESIQARMFESADDYLIPVRLDDTEIPGVLKTLAYIDGRQHTPSQVAALIQAKVQGKSVSRAILNKPGVVEEVKKPPEKQKKSARPRAASESDGRRKVSSSGQWVLLGDAFYEAVSVFEETNTLQVRIAPKTTREEADLRTLQTRISGHRDTLRFVHGNNAERCRVEEVSSRSENGKVVYSLTLQLDREHSHAIEFSMSNLSADEVAEKRARLILLNEPLSFGKSSQDQHILRGFGSPTLEAGVIANVLRKWGGAVTRSNLQKARLEAICQLKSFGIIEHVLEFSLGPATKAGLAVAFEGSRPTQGQSKGFVIRVSGTLTLADHS